MVNLGGDLCAPMAMAPMYDWYERQVERFVRWVMFRLAAVLHPELLRIRNANQRAWAVQFGFGHTGSRRRAIATSSVMLGVPATLAASAIIIGGAFDLIGREHVIITLIMAWIIGTALAAGMLEIARRRSAQRRCLVGLRIIGFDVCLSCGYDMIGHAVEDDRPRRCPECGCDVPPPSAARRNAPRRAA